MNDFGVSDELLEFLVGLGATPEDLEEYRNELPALASVLALRPGKERLTNAEVAERAGIDPEQLSRLIRAAGFIEIGPGERMSSEADVEVFAMTSAAAALFGEQAIIQLTRVIGSSMARIADAAVSAFLVNVELPLLDGEDVPLSVAKANAQAAVFLEPLARSMDLLLRRHILAARRSILGVQAAGGYEQQQLAVGFVDLVGSSALDMSELGVALTEFESLAFDAVVGLGGRIVKLIGDEVMFAAADPSLACSIAAQLVGALVDHAVTPPARAGLAFGDVLTAGGDCFGPVVNLAARAAKRAAPSTVVVNAELRGRLGADWRTESLGPQELSGFPEAVELWTVEGL